MHPVPRPAHLQRLATLPGGSGSRRRATPTRGYTNSLGYEAVGRLDRFTNAMNQVWERHDCAGWQSIEERDDSGDQQAKYVYGAGLDEPVRMYRSSTYYYYLSDGLGNVTEVLDASGNVVEKYTYDIYGAPTIRNSAGTVLSATAIGNRWLFTGRDWDAEQQAYDYRYRWYSPSLGRFLQTDPIGTVGGLNLYRFPGNAPSMRLDPFGLAGEMALIGMGGQGFAQFATPGGLQAYAGASAAASQAGYGGNLAAASANEMYSQALQQQAQQVLEFYRNVVLAEGGGAALAHGPKACHLARVTLKFRGPEYGRWKDAGVWQEGWHFHLGSDYGLYTHHLPQQIGKWWKNVKAVAARIWGSE